jgi:hypothetical protein
MANERKLASLPVWCWRKSPAAIRRFESRQVTILKNMSSLKEVYGPTFKTLLAIEEIRRNFIQAVGGSALDAETLARFADAEEALALAEKEFDKLFGYAAAEVQKQRAKNMFGDAFLIDSSNLNTPHGGK